MTGVDQTHILTPGCRVEFKTRLGLTNIHENNFVHAPRYYDAQTNAMVVAKKQMLKSNRRNSDFSRVFLLLDGGRLFYVDINDDYINKAFHVYLKIDGTL